MINTNSFKVLLCLFCLMSMTGCMDNPLSSSGKSTSPETESNNSGNNPNDPDSPNNYLHEEFSITQGDFGSKKLDILVIFPGNAEAEVGKLGMNLSRLLLRSDLACRLASGFYI